MSSALLRLCGTVRHMHDPCPDPLRFQSSGPLIPTAPPLLPREFANTLVPDPCRRRPSSLPAPLSTFGGHRRTCRTLYCFLLSLVRWTHIIMWYFGNFVSVLDSSRRLVLLRSTRNEFSHKVAFHLHHDEHALDPYQAPASAHQQMSALLSG